MEVGYQPVYNPEVKAGPDKQVATALPLAQPATVIDSVFQGARTGSAKSNDTPPLLLGKIDSRRGIRRHNVIFLVHAMFGQIIGAHRQKSPKPDMQRQSADIDPPGPQSLKDSPGKMKAGGGCGNGTRRSGEDGLIADMIFFGGFPSDIRRKRNSSDPAKDRGKVSGAFETHMPVGRSASFGNDTLKSFPETQAHAGARRLGTPGQAGPGLIVARQAPHQKHLDTSASLLAAQKTRRNHPCIVDNKHVPCAKPVDDFGETRQLCLLRFPVENHQSGGLAFLQRVLGNQRFRKFEIEIIQTHMMVYNFRQCQAPGSIICLCRSC